MSIKSILLANIKLLVCFSLTCYSEMCMVLIEVYFMELGLLRMLELHEFKEAQALCLGGRYGHDRRV